MISPMMRHSSGMRIRTLALAAVLIVALTAGPATAAPEGAAHTVRARREAPRRPKRRASAESWERYPLEPP